MAEPNTTAMALHMHTLDRLMRSAPVIPVLVVDELAHAVPLARALVAGGLRVLEFTLRTPVSLDAVKAVSEAIPDAFVGTGTVRTPAQLQASVDAGACFAVSPGAGPRLLDAAADCPIPLLPGAVTASEVMALEERGHTRQKFFPAVASGGPAVLKAFSSPLSGVVFCPTGGITVQTAPTWLALPNVACVGGSWVAPKALVHAGDWAAITALAQAAVALGQPSPTRNKPG